jgi:hypothetical protein
MGSSSDYKIIGIVYTYATRKLFHALKLLLLGLARFYFVLGESLFSVNFNFEIFIIEVYKFKYHWTLLLDVKFFWHSQCQLSKIGVRGNHRRKESTYLGGTTNLKHYIDISIIFSWYNDFFQLIYWNYYEFGLIDFGGRESKSIGLDIVLDMSFS